MKATILSLALALSGCSMSAIHRGLKSNSAPFMNCPPEQTKVSHYTWGGSTWRVDGCGKAAVCRMTPTRSGFGHDTSCVYDTSAQQ